MKRSETVQIINSVLAKEDIEEEKLVSALESSKECIRKLQKISGIIYMDDMRDDTKVDLIKDILNGEDEE